MHIIHYLKKLYYGLLPFTCLLCHHPSTRKQDLCELCHDELPILAHSCQRCACEMIMCTENSVCQDCVDHPPPFTKSYALFSYQSNIKRLILNLKFNHALLNAQLFGELLAKKIRHCWYLNSPLPDLIIPVPLHIKRLKKRGFNQALEIARPLHQALKIPLEITACQRHKYTAPQAMLEGEKRQENVKNAFTVNKLFLNQHIAILDDVVTTGSTVTELARLLVEAGASRVDVWCCARAVMNKKT